MSQGGLLEFRAKFDQLCDRIDRYSFKTRIFILFLALVAIYLMWDFFSRDPLNKKEVNHKNKNKSPHLLFQHFDLQCYKKYHLNLSM